MSRKSRMVPKPKNSRRTPTMRRTIAYPEAAPAPSRKAGSGGTFLAIASARPMTRQLVMIRPTKTERVRDIS